MEWSIRYCVNSDSCFTWLWNEHSFVRRCCCRQWHTHHETMPVQVQIGPIQTRFKFKLNFGGTSYIPTAPSLGAVVIQDIPPKFSLNSNLVTSHLGHHWFLRSEYNIRGIRYLHKLISRSITWQVLSTCPVLLAIILQTLFIYMNTIGELQWCGG